MNASDVIVIYPGRFHPFHKGHKGVFDLLNSKFKNVYIATSEKVEPGRSPFNFEEKVQIMGMLGVQPNDVLKVKQTYNGMEYMSRFNNSYGLIFAVSEKDMDEDPRFNFPASGMNLKKNGEPAYLQKFTDLNKVEDMTKHGYIMTVPTTTFKVAGHDVNSASQIRSLLGSDNIDDAKQAFVDLYDKYNETVFNLIHNKLGGKTMESIDINELRKLAGLQERDMDVDDDYSDVPGYKEKPMFDQLGKIIDSDEMSKDGDDIKNPLSTVKTDDGEEVEVSVGEAKALKKMMEMLPSARMGDEKSAREKFLDTIQKAEGLHSMIEFARGKGLVEEADVEEGNAFAKKVRDLKAQGKKKGEKFELDGEEYALEDLDLDDIRADFGVEEGRVKDLAMDMVDEFYDKVSAMVDKSNDLGKSVVDAWDDGDENPPSWALDDETRAILVNAGKIEDEPEEPEMEEAAKPDYIDLDGDGDREESMKKAAKDKKKKEESFDPRAEQSREDQAYDELVDAYDKGGEDGLCKAIGCSSRELDHEMSEYARDHRLHMDDDRDEIIHGYIEQLVDDADWKDHGEMDYDRDMEEDLDRMRELAGIEERKIQIAPKFEYDDEQGYDENFSLWFAEVQSERRREKDHGFPDEPYPQGAEKEGGEAHKDFQVMLKQQGIDIFKQKQISLAKKLEKEKADRMKFRPEPKQAKMDF